MEQEIDKIVEKHGWYALAINDQEPPFLYSVGLMKSHEHPEFIIFGLESSISHVIVGDFIARIRQGERFDSPGIHSLDFEKGPLQFAFRPVHSTQQPLYLGYAMGYCRHIGRVGELGAMQIFWPDPAGKFPFDANCGEDTYASQPRLDIGLTPDELEAFDREWE